MSNGLDLIKWAINDLTKFFMDLGGYLFRTLGDIIVNDLGGTIPAGLEFLNKTSLIGFFSVNIVFLILLWKCLALVIPN